eukprot:TRINITY_DN9063_c0_g1_i1.p1 TRINITY_DN9063_c0_g1~~TRINITY_DN9063_c0_g1_i1.p1  ORF type:complete len:778 (+),score=200.35 TRINITY_DN9063_c0_g1_i1:72-2405(+)
MAARESAYFAERNKGEVGELRTKLKQILNEKDLKKRRDVIKRVVAFMTMGIDVSRLFTDMVMATNTKDLVQKKMIYLYLCNYAESNPDLALLAINTLQKDCRDENPMVRALALRSICSLRLPNILEYIVEVVRKGLNDPSGYVRKTAVLGVAKLHQLSPTSLREGSEVELLETVRQMIRDRDPQVVTNCLCTLNEVFAADGGIVLESHEIASLLGKLRDFNEWNQAIVLGVLSRAKPSSEDEIFEIMNVLDDKFKHNNAAVVLAVCNIFFKLTSNMPDVLQSVYQRVRDPLLTLMSTASSPEVMYACLHHISLIISRSSAEFQNDFKSFYIQYNDPSHIKMLKLDILTNICTLGNFPEIVTELSEYVTDVDIPTARESIRSIGKIALKLPEAADEIIQQFIKFFSLETDYVTNETLIVMKDLFRKYPRSSMGIINEVKACAGRVTDPDAKVAIIWMIAEFGDLIPESPYILETMADKFLEEQSSEVQLELLSSVVKLFFKRPPECKAMLGKILRDAIQEATHNDVHDRALLYYRMISTNINKAASIVSSSANVVDSFAEDETFEFKDRLFEEFNTLSVVYRLPQEKFIVDKKSSDPEPDSTVDDEEDDDNLSDAVESEDEAEAERITGRGTTGQQGTTTLSSADLDIFEGLNKSQPEAEPASLQLVENPSIDPQTFQKKWGGLAISAVMEIELDAAPSSCKELEGHFKSHHVYCMASGVVGDVMKLFLYGQESEGAFMFMEFVVKLSAKKATATIKVDQEEKTDDFAEYVEDITQSL